MKRQTTVLVLLAALLLGVLVGAIVFALVPAEAAQDYFDIILQDGDTDEIWWTATYLRSLPSGAGWADGDRSGYKCAYMFLLNAAGVPVGRVTFTRVDVPRELGGNYAYVIDRFMVEGARYFDGTLAPEGSNEIGDCPAPAQSYEPWGGPDQRPTIVFATRRGSVLETRDYKLTDAAPGVMFRQVEKLSGPMIVTGALGGSSTIYGRVTVVAYVDGLPTIVVYYDSLVRGTLVTSDLS